MNKEMDVLVRPAYVDTLKKALNGCKKSQESLVCMYHSGELCPPDQIKAFAWASVAHSLNNSDLLNSIKIQFSSESELLMAQDIALRLARIIEA